jgi:hypothetical protein
MNIGIHVKYSLFSGDNKTWVCSTDLKKYSNIKIKKKSPLGAESHEDGEKNRFDEANSRFSQFCERA